MMNEETTKILKETQLKLDQALIENKGMRKKNADLNIQLLNQEKAENPAKSTKNNQYNSKKKEESALEPDDRIAICARKFGVLNELFLNSTLFMVENPGCNPYTKDRYATPVSAATGLIAELYREVPKDLHQRMAKHTSFRDTFLEKFHSNRRIIIHKLRNDIAPVVFKRSKEDFQPKAKRASIEEFVKAVYCSDNSGKKRFSKFAPILYPDRDITQKNALFRSEELALMLRGILFGASSVLDTSKTPDAKSNGKKWGIQHTTPGAIALVATLAIFLHSKDTVLETVGAESNIPYGKTFDAYKCILIRNSLLDDPNTADTFDFYNGIVFQNIKAKGKNRDTQDSQDESSGVEDAICDLTKMTMQQPEADNFPKIQKRIILSQIRIRSIILKTFQLACLRQTRNILKMMKSSIMRIKFKRMPLKALYQTLTNLLVLM
ncbi:hypothetical protein BJ912DRAFT_464958 [Pholiota molesta]|nr:hypothetical protein BJ912DRAFT_464958 [Pholiota molesta]